MSEGNVQPLVKRVNKIRLVWERLEKFIVRIAVDVNQHPLRPIVLYFQMIFLCGYRKVEL